MPALDTYRPGLWRRIAVAGCRRGGSKPVRFDYVQSGHRIIERQYQSGSGRVHGYHHAQGATAADRCAIRRGRANAHASVAASQGRHRHQCFDFFRADKDHPETGRGAEQRFRFRASPIGAAIREFFIQCQKGRRVDRRAEEAGRGADEGQSAIHRYPVEHHPIRAESDAEQGYRGYQAVVSSRSQLFFFLTPSRVMALSRLFPGFGCRLWHLSNFR
ncbi:hypothetical protein GBJ15_01870 [Bifidobacterium longum]|nr:hypothetical protein GBI57_02205 [Bifidobacterium longum]KAB7023569.1 hypothetical protein GBI72_01670 [Bifidobacterium longum]KAB7029346.1 hypothetical protein GBJ20_02440 [Bifidobacterium longum]KAB7036136.1 hypothetical protein GBI55_01870 [Bifidobacterium longum]KAB7040972.1 hypothetical protein GBI41_01965 [Bifidobacterium longum]